jgi:hypothetical protein
MWHDGDYRVIFRHEDVSPLNIHEVADAFIGTWNKGLIKGCVSSGPRCEPNPEVLHGISVMTTAVLQKRLTEGGLTAWATLGIGYAFCNYRDQFCKAEGRKRAFERAIRTLPIDQHLTVFIGIFMDKVVSKEEEKNGKDLLDL